MLKRIFIIILAYCAIAQYAMAQDPVTQTLTAGLAPISTTPGLTSIKICSFDGTRSDAPFATATGANGYAQLRSDLTNPANFGPAGTVHTSITIAPGVPTLSSTTLAGCNIFFTSRMTSSANSTEVAALKAAVLNGMHLIVETDSGSAAQAAVNAILTGIGATGRSVGPATACTASSTGGTFSSFGNPVTGANFGNLTNQTFATNASAAVTIPIPSSAEAVGSCSTTLVRSYIYRQAIGFGSGAIMIGGDLSGTDQYTMTTGGYYNANNEKMYLNAVADAAGLFFPTCFVGMSKTSYVNGDALTISNLVVGNANPFPLPIEYKIWFEVPGSPAVPFMSGGNDGSTVLAPRFSNNFGPMPVTTVTSSLPRGTYRVGCVLSDPVSTFFIDPRFYVVPVYLSTFTLQ